MTVTLRPVPESLRIPPAPREITRASRVPLNVGSKPETRRSRARHRLDVLLSSPDKAARFEAVVNLGDSE